MSAIPAARVILTSLHLYPVKGARALDCTRARTSSHGLEFDREWMLIDGRGQFLTQRSDPTLALLTALPSATGVHLSHPNAGDTIVLRPDPFASTPVTRRVTIWKREQLAYDAGDLAAQFVSAIVGRPARLMAASSATFPDGYPLLVCTRASLEDLNRRMGVTLPMNRFRPNLVIDGVTAWDEDRISSLQIGSVEVRFVKACTRCVVTRIDQATGRAAEDPLPTLRSFRFDETLRGVTFGYNARISRGAGEELRVGDEVSVRWRDDAAS